MYSVELLRWAEVPGVHRPLGRDARSARAVSCTGAHSRDTSPSWDPLTSASGAERFLQNPAGKYSMMGKAHTFNQQALGRCRQTRHGFAFEALSGWNGDKAQLRLGPHIRARAEKVGLSTTEGRGGS